MNNGKELLNDKITIGIIGGTGAMGRWFNEFFTEAGYAVLISSRKTTLSLSDLAKQSDIVIISVPLDAADKVAEEIGPLLNQNQLLTDFCSLKEDILHCMMRSTQAEVVGMHPLFGPFLDTIQGQNIIICPGRGTKWLHWLENLFQTKGANVRQMDASVHDRNMALFQGLTHMLSISMGRTLQKLNMTPAEAKFYSTPVFRVNLDLIGRLFAQDLYLYKNLISRNKYIKEVINIFVSSLEESQNNLFVREYETENGLLEDIRFFLGDFCKEGLNESNEFFKVLFSKKN